MKAELVWISLNAALKLSETKPPFLMPILFRTTKAKEILSRSSVATEISLLESSEIA